jgi:hypothetical protein
VKPLNVTQVTRCEMGRTPRCRCRCGGVLHGAQRARLPEYFENLGESDPHRLEKKSRQLRLPAPVGSEE